MKENILGNRLAQLRKQNRYSQREVGDKLGVSSTAVYKWESGFVEPSLDTLVQLCGIFSVSADYLLGLTDDIKKDPPTEVDEPTVTVAVPVDDPALSTQSAFEKLLESLVEDALRKRGL